MVDYGPHTLPCSRRARPQVGVLPVPLDGIYYENLNPYKRPYPRELEKFSKLPHGRKFFDFPHGPGPPGAVKCP